MQEESKQGAGREQEESKQGVRRSKTGASSVQEGSKPPTLKPLLQLVQTIHPHSSQCGSNYIQATL